MSKSLHLPSRILKVYIENLTGLSYVYPPDSLSNTFLSGGCVLEKGSNCGNSEHTYISRTRMRVRSLQSPESSSRVTSGHNASMTSFNAQTRRDEADVTIKCNTIGYWNRKRILVGK